MIFKTLILSIFCLMFSFNINAKIIGKLLVNGSDNHVMEAGAPTNLEIKFIDDMPMPPDDSDEDNEDGGMDMPMENVITNFRRMHMKYMHFVIMKDDLTVFRHIHPYLDMQSGKFMMPINLPNGDFDNQDAAKGLVEPGNYHVYAEVDLKDIGMRKFHWNLQVKGTSVQRERELDHKVGNKIVKYFGDDGIVGEYGAKYEGTLSYHTVRGCGGNFITYKLEVREYDPQTGYDTLQNIQPWLMMGGHAILLNKAKELEEQPSVFAHLHAKMPDAEIPFFELTHFDRYKMTKDKYSFWFQFNHAGKILSVPFVFEYLPPERIQMECGQ